MPSNAAKEWSGTLKELEDKRDKLKRQIRRCLNEHKKFDKQDPDTVERQRRSQQTLDTLNKAFDKVDQFLKTAAQRMGQGKRPKGSLMLLPKLHFHHPWWSSKKQYYRQSVGKNDNQ